MGISPEYITCQVTKMSLNKFKKIEVIPSILSDHNGMKLEMSNRSKTGKFTAVENSKIMGSKKKSKGQLENTS